MMAKTTRQSGPEAKTAPSDPLHQMKPGGPILPTKQGFVNPGPTKNLRGVEPNTAFHKGQPNEEQHGSPGKMGDHNPGTGEADNAHGHGVPLFGKPRPGAAKHHAVPAPTPMPGDVAR
jgi:hypothetical protein